ncbi:hypothetical protein [Streptomyces sp. MJP52]|uniref:hypothetical protein n=1 Tax=Streptomyces sp. MJP52 TaxID=2940555 RepID=UPI002474FE68|nr:hypothetical protein [Streptomyces sp. MJP52]MDH6228840.1 hypothetical protein [Streptomyces sp. MJP52]
MPEEHRGHGCVLAPAVGGTAKLLPGPVRDRLSGHLTFQCRTGLVRAGPGDRAGCAGAGPAARRSAGGARGGARRTEARHP